MPESASGHGMEYEAGRQHGHGWGSDTQWLSDYSPGEVTPHMCLWHSSSTRVTLSSSATIWHYYYYCFYYKWCYYSVQVHINQWQYLLYCILNIILIYIVYNINKIFTTDCLYIKYIKSEAMNCKYLMILNVFFTIIYLKLWNRNTSLVNQ